MQSSSHTACPYAERGGNHAGGAVSTQATVSTGTTSNHEFWRKCFTGFGVNDGFGQGRV